MQAYNFDNSQYYETSGGSHAKANQLQICLTTETESSGDENSRQLRSSEVEEIRSPIVLHDKIKITDLNFNKSIHNHALTTDEIERETDHILTNVNSARDSLIEGEGETT